MTLAVIDSSIALAWCFQDEASAQTDAMLEQLRRNIAVAPELWLLEICNVLLMAERRGRITPEAAAENQAALMTLPILLDSMPDSHLPEISALARRASLTVYDAVYLDLALRRQLPLWTLDRELAAAAQRFGVTVAP